MKIKLKKGVVDGLLKQSMQALQETADALKSDLQNSETMPFKTGVLQNDSMYVRSLGKKVKISTNTPYARRLYFHPEYKFNTAHNSKAGALWWEPYISGEKKEFPKRLYIKFLKGKIK